MTSYNSGNAGVKAEDIWKSAPLVNGNKGGPRTTEPQEAQKQQHQAEGIFGATLASLNVILDTCRRTICSMTGLEYGKPPSTNYILWLFFFIKDALVSPIAGKFYALGQPERIFALGLALVVSWIPALLLFFCIIPSAVIFIVAFYMMMFGLAPLKQHLEEGLNELTGLSTMDVKEYAAELTKDVGNRLRDKTKLAENYLQVEVNRQKVINIFCGLCAQSLKVLLSSLKALESVLTGQLNKVQAQKTD